MKMNIDVLSGYEPLAAVLVDALNQAQIGKGKRCHAGGRIFLEQPIMTELAAIGPVGHVYQVRKKVREAADCNDDNRAIEDLLGAIVYTAAMVIYRRDMVERSISSLQVDGMGRGQSGKEVEIEGLRN